MRHALPCTWRGACAPQGLSHGASDYLVKPLRAAELMARITTQLALRRCVRVAAEARANASLLRSILPRGVIARLRGGQRLIAQHHPQVRPGQAGQGCWGRPVASPGPAPAAMLLRQWTPDRTPERTHAWQQL